MDICGNLVRWWMGWGLPPTESAGTVGADGFGQLLLKEMPYGQGGWQYYVDSKKFV